MTLQEVTAHFAAEPRLLFCSDFDGTLAPIQSHPDKAHLSGVARRLLWRLSRSPGSMLAVVSGRSLLDLRHKVALPDIWYVGNHGLEIMGPDTSYVHPDLSTLRPTLGEWIWHVRKDLDGIPGLLIEDKQYTASVHYRLVKVEHRGRIEMVLRQSCPTTFEVRGGKMVWEMRPRIDWHKGWGIDWLARHIEAPVIFLGDDVTDEDAFETLRNCALTIKVGPGQTSAHFRLPDVDGVLRWIAAFVELRQGEEAEPEKSRRVYPGGAGVQEQAIATLTTR
jgi:trehalose 6-phosphate phosphatase